MVYNLNTPKKLMVVTESVNFEGVCFNCMDKLVYPYLAIYNDSKYSCFCKRCAYKEIENQQARLNFIANDINKLKEFFPKKVKAKPTGNINFGEHL